MDGIASPKPGPQNQTFERSSVLGRRAERVLVHKIQLLNLPTTDASVVLSTRFRTYFPNKDCLSTMIF